MNDKIRAGDRIYATDAQALHDQARRAQLGITRRNTHSPKSAVFKDPANTCEALNADSVTIPNYCPVEISGHVAESETTRVFKITLPTSNAVGRFGVVAGGIEVGYVGKLHLSGVCLVNLKTNSGDKFADVKTAGDTFLTGDPTDGGAEILYEEGGSSLTAHLGLIRFPRGGSGGSGNATALCAVTSTSDSHSGLAARDAITPVDGDIILDTKATTASARGLWVAHSGAWTRPTTKLTRGMLVTVRDGSASGNSVWFLDITTDPVVVGTTALLWTRLIQPINSPTFAYARCAGTGLTHSGLTAVDGVTPIAGDLIFDLSVGSIYTAASGAWTVSSAAPLIVFVAEGSTYGPLAYALRAGGYNVVGGVYT